MISQIYPANRTSVPALNTRQADHQRWPEAVETSAPVFYIQAPRYTPRSGGIIACHVLCQELNRLGYEAYVAASDVSGTLWTPMLTREIVRAHKKAGRRPIAIYPEVYIGNNLNRDRVIRYLLNRPGVMSLADPDATNAFWQSPARKSEFHIHFAEEFRVPYLNSVPLYTPIVDEGIFFEEVGRRAGGLRRLLSSARGSRRHGPGLGTAVYISLTRFASVTSGARPPLSTIARIDRVRAHRSANGGRDVRLPSRRNSQQEFLAIAGVPPLWKPRPGLGCRR